jgi:NitT/TauT family transport system permease protein
MAATDAPGPVISLDGASEPSSRRLDDALAGLDALDLPPADRRRLARSAWAVTWPKLAAVAMAVALWQLVVWSGWKPTYVLPAPWTVLRRFGSELGEDTTWRAIATTMRRAGVGFAVSLVIGTVLGLAVAQWRVLRLALGSLISGLQTMPSIAWFPLAILLFKLSEAAILFVVVLGAAPAIANGVIAGVDQIPPLWHRAGRVLGANGFARYRHIVFPAALPGFLAGLKGGWAFAWRSLMAGELIVIIANKPSIGSRLSFEREFADAPGLMSVMLVILVIGIAVDGLGFSTLDRVVRRRRGLEVTVNHRRSGE